MPLLVSGEIIEGNAALSANPELINSDPYGEGWIVKIQLADLSQVAQLMNVAQYQEMVGQGH